VVEVPQPEIERAAEAIQAHKFDAQSSGESGITVLCTCGHQSTAPGFREARKRHYEHVAVAALGAVTEQPTASLNDVRGLKRRWYNLMEAGPNGFGLAPHGDGWALKINVLREPEGDVPTEIDGLPLLVDAVGEVTAAGRLGVTATPPPPTDRDCSVDGCDRFGGRRVTTDEPLCEKHYQQWRKASIAPAARSVAAPQKHLRPPGEALCGNCATTAEEIAALQLEVTEEAEKP